MRITVLWLAPLLLLGGCGKMKDAPGPATAAASAPASTSANGAAGEPVPGPAVAEAAASPNPAPPLEPAAPSVPERQSIRIPAGTPLRVRTLEALDTARNRAGDHFEATLAEPVRVHGELVLPRGTRFRGHITAAKSSGRLKGRGYLTVTLDSFALHGESYRIHTSARGTVTANHNKRNAGFVGGGAGLGALIGGIAGGGKGALIGAGSGAAAGTAGAAITGKRHARLPAESVLTFRLRSPVALTTG